MVIEHIVEAIQHEQLQGARIQELVVLCGAGALKLIEQELKPKLVATDDSGKRYPLVEKYLGQLMDRSRQAEIMGVPVLFDVDCPTDCWRVQRLPAIAYPPEFGKDSRWRWNAQKQNWIRNEKTRCPLCGKESDQAPMLLFGMKVVGCSCVEAFAGERYDGVMIDEKAEYKQRAIEMLNDAMRDGREAIKRSGKRWSECWSDEIADRTVKKIVKNKPLRIYDDLPLEACFHRLELRARPGYESRADPTLPEPFTSLTVRQEEAARSEWSRRLRELQAEARRKEREQVVVDIDWE